MSKSVHSAGTTGAAAGAVQAAAVAPAVIAPSCHVRVRMGPVSHAPHATAPRELEADDPLDDEVHADQAERRDPQPA